MSDSRRLLLGGGLVVALTVLVSVLASPEMPAEMATHWNASGDGDGTMSRPFALGLVPAITAITVGFFAVLPRVDPRTDYAEFRDAYDAMALATAGFLAYTHVVLVLFNAGYEFGVLQAIAPAIGGIYVVGGFVTDRAEQNWFVGVRTPWTLEDETVWARTNHVLARVLQAGGLVAAAGVLVPAYALSLVVAPAVVAAIGGVGYSYYAYQATAGQR
jgi:uncharacterized membrane protein